MYYFAYGSNMNSERMLDRCVNYYEMLPGVLDNYKLTFNKISTCGYEGFATVEESFGEHVEGILYRVTRKGIKNLDVFEGYPYHYIRKYIPVRIRESEKYIKAYVYIAHEDMTGENLTPSQSYLNHLLKGKQFLSRNYYQKLKKVRGLLGDNSNVKEWNRLEYIKIEWR